MEECSAPRVPLHVAVFPWLAFGHMIPFLKLAKAMARKGHKISFLSTPRNIQRLPKIPPGLVPFVDLVELRLPAVDGLQEGAESTTDLPPDQVQYLKKAFDGLENQVAGFLQTATPKLDWIVHDFAHHWIFTIAAGSNIRCAFFSVFPAHCCAFLGPPARICSDVVPSPAVYTTPPEWITIPSTVANRLHEAKAFISFFTTNVSGISDTKRFGFTVERCHVVGIRDCEEFSGRWLSLLQKIYDNKVVSVGFLPPSLEEIEANRGAFSSSPVSHWLDKQEAGTVVYVALGSEAVLSVDLLHQLALGLELSGLPFLWALRRPKGLSEVERLLPQGFEERTKGRGMVAMGWVPQLNVLAHASIGGFLTHVGWSSVIEGIRFGHPLVSLPVFGDQGPNARLLAEKKMALEIERNEDDGHFSKEAVAKALRTAMVEEAGEEIRATAREMAGGIFSDHDLHDRCVDGFIKNLRDHNL